MEWQSHSIFAKISVPNRFLARCKEMTEKPDYILTFDRPKNTEIKKIGNNWYLYERFSKYDPTIKRSRKVSGRCLGKITPDGLIATKRRLTPAERPAAVLEETVEVGASLFMWKRTEDLRKRLQVHFLINGSKSTLRLSCGCSENLVLSAFSFTSKTASCRMFSRNCHSPLPTMQPCFGLWVKNVRQSAALCVKT